ncbi:MAG: hypothetical protein H6Q66_814 [Firmicutes bacterium]|nr:hypothetical protein [Bacillota bacterium]
MTSKTTRRGFDPKDCKWFSEQAIEKIKLAQQEVQWLLDKGYKMGAIIDFVGGHYQLSSRQRMALQRATASKLQYSKRKSTMLSLESAKDSCIYIDGFNLIITLEVALSGSILILGNDGVLRDLAGLRGTYSIINHTNTALYFIGKSFAQLAVPEVKFFLDAPVSNSAKLRSRILEHAAEWAIPVEVELVPNADIVLAKRARIVTGDSILLDECSSWLNISRKIVDDYIKDAWLVNLMVHEDGSGCNYG